MTPRILLPLLFLGLFATLRAEELPKVIRFGEVGGVNVRNIGGKPSGVWLVPLAIERGFFDQEFGKDGPKIESVYFSGTGPAQNEALAQGNIDFGSYGGLPNVIGLSAGIPAHIVAVRKASGSAYYLAVHPDAPIKSLAELKGKRIAVQKGTNAYQTLVLFLESQGVAEKDVSIVNLQGAEAINAFNAGAIDAVFGTTALLVLRDQGKARILADTRHFKHGGNTSGVLVADKFEKAYPETVARVVKILTRTAQWASQEENRETLLRYISERSYDYNYIKEEYAGSLAERYDPLIDETAIADYRETAKFAAEHKMIRKEPPESVVRSWFKPEYQKAGLKELKLETFWNSPVGQTASTP